MQTTVQLPDKKVKLALVGLDGNAFSLMGAFKKQPAREGWTREEISAVLDACKAGDYDHLLCTLMTVCEDPATEEEGEDTDDEDLDEVEEDVEDDEDDEDLDEDDEDLDEDEDDEE